MRDFYRRKSRVPIVQMNNVRRTIRALYQRQCRLTEKRETVVIFPKTVDRTAVKKLRRINQKRRRTVRLAVKNIRPNRTPAPINPKIIKRDFPQMFALRLTVIRRNQHRIHADFLQRLRQRARDIAQSARF